MSSPYVIKETKQSSGHIVTTIDLAKAIEVMKDPTVTGLDLNQPPLCNTALGVNGAKKIAASLVKLHFSGPCQISSLNLYGNGIGDEGMQHISKSLQHHFGQITSLNTANLLGIQFHHSTRILCLFHFSSASSPKLKHHHRSLQII